jgi:hypothetical protein
LPAINVASLVAEDSHTFIPDTNIQTISVDLMAVMGNTVVAITRDANIFYDTEILAIVHRSKSKSSGLVSTDVWGWQGKQSKIGEREERKLQDLAKRYSTTVVRVCSHSVFYCSSITYIFFPENDQRTV